MKSLKGDKKELVRKEEKEKMSEMEKVKQKKDQKPVKEQLERKIKSITPSQFTREGAGVRLRRAFGFNQDLNLDPFLLLDDFHSDNPQDYMAGFPWHPHRGIETITYMINGQIKHQDSMGNGGIIDSGDVQWMTAGSGIIHSEMPNRTQGMMMGFQLWANLPASHKMMNPRYREVKEEQIPEIEQEHGTIIKIIAGKIGNAIGPVKDIITEPEYLDVSIPPETTFTHPIRTDYNAFAYIFQGKGHFDSTNSREIDQNHLVVFTEGEYVKITTNEENVRFLLISGRPIKEPVAWYGPIVMNTQKELQLAFEEYRNGTFIKYGQKKGI